MGMVTYQGVSPGIDELMRLHTLLGRRFQHVFPTPMHRDNDKTLWVGGSQLSDPCHARVDIVDAHRGRIGQFGKAL